jgi:hypothetical protein
MRETIEEMFGRTTAVMTRLTEQAQEAEQAGASRRRFFAKTAALAGATALGATGAALMQPIAAYAASSGSTTTPDTAQSIIDIAATAEALATTFYFNALGSGTLPNVNSQANRNYFQAAVQEFEHLTYLMKIGATPIVTEFYYPTDMFSDEKVFFPTAGTLEEYFISAYIAAAKEFSGGVAHKVPLDPRVIGLAVQIAGIECEHRALLRVAANLNPPNNVIIETGLLKRVGDAVAPLQPFLEGGQGYSGPYKLPSHGEVNAIAWPYGFDTFPKYKVV